MMINTLNGSKMMRLDEFNKPDYENMSEEELTEVFEKGLMRLRKTIDESNERIENELRLGNQGNLHQISQT